MDIARAIIVMLLKITIALMMVSMGLQIRRRVLLELWRHPRVLWGGLAAAFVVVPLIAFGVLWMIPLSVPAKVGLLVIAITPGAPMVYRSATRRGLSDPELAAGFQVSVAVLVIVLAPLWLIVAGLMSGSRLGISPLVVARQVCEVQLIPIVVGLLIQHWLPGFAERTGQLISRIGFLIMISLVVAILAVISPQIVRNAAVWDLAATVLVALSAVAGGHYLTGPALRARVTIANANAQRNPGLALTIVAWSFPHLKASAMLVIIVYIFVAGITAAVYTRIVSRRHPAEAAE